MESGPITLLHNMKKAFSIVELIIVVIVVGILVSFGMPAYLKAKTKAIDREAQSQLKLIQAAQKVYRMETNNYIACVDNDDCDTKLNTELPPGTGNGGNWNYSVAVVGGVPPTFNVQAVGSRGTSDWQIDQDDEKASSF